jgi:hypothetical protein
MNVTEKVEYFHVVVCVERAEARTLAADCGTRLRARETRSRGIAHAQLI